MTYHHWGDEWQHWDDLYEAERFIRNYVRKYSRCYLLSKEKYGTLRYEHIIPPGGHVMLMRYTIKAPWKKRLKIGDEEISYNPVLFCWNQCYVYRLWQRLGNYVLKKAVRKACRKYPHLVIELTEDFSWEYDI